MFKNKGNWDKAQIELKDNVATAFVYDKKNNVDGPLNDVVVTLKDLFATDDAPTQASSKILEGFMPGYNATIVNKLKEAGADIIAKVHMDELALGGTGLLSAYGEISNPLDEKRLIGGSSSGSAATFTDSIGLAIGSDTGDSVRLPASYAGLYGFKPSYGAISRYGMFAYASSLDTVGMFGHNINDIVEASKVLYGKDEMDMTSKDVEHPEMNEVKPNKVGFVKDTSDLTDYQIEEYNKLKEQVKADGIEIIEIELDDKLLHNIDTVYQSISFSEASSNDSNLTGIQFGPGRDGKDWSEIMHNTRSELLGDLVQRRFTLGAYFLAHENQQDIFVKAQKVRRLIVEMFTKAKAQVDVLLFPSTEIAPLKSNQKEDSWTTSYLIHSNLSGTPSITIPWAKHDGMPFGLSIDGRQYEDKKLISHAIYIDKLIGGKND